MSRLHVYYGINPEEEAQKPPKKAQKLSVYATQKDWTKAQFLSLNEEEE